MSGLCVGVRRRTFISWVCGLGLLVWSASWRSMVSNTGARTPSRGAFLNNQEPIIEEEEIHIDVRRLLVRVAFL